MTFPIIRSYVLFRSRIIFNCYRLFASLRPSLELTDIFTTLLCSYFDGAILLLNR